LGHVSFVVSGFYQLDGLSVGSLISFVDTNDPAFRGEGFSEVMEFKVFVARIGISNIVVTFRLAVLSINLPGAVIAEFVHQAVLHRGKDHIVDSVSIS